MASEPAKVTLQNFEWAALLREVWPNNTAKLAARAGDVPLRTVEGWLNNGHVPGYRMIFIMAERDPRFKQAMLALLQKDDAKPELPLSAGDGVP